jgi:hypothetical protein
MLEGFFTHFCVGDTPNFATDRFLAFQQLMLLTASNAKRFTIPQISEGFVHQNVAIGQEIIGTWIMLIGGFVGAFG